MQSKICLSSVKSSTPFLQLLQEKKNIILQGPPGVGKTYFSKRLAYALLGEKDPNRVGMVQFHQSYAYEDFVQGYRPSGDGFRLRDGIFFQFCAKAKRDLSQDYVFIIDEINRGNLSKIFGELMLLIEADKRGDDWEIPLAYSDGPDEKFSIPEKPLSRRTHEHGGSIVGDGRLCPAAAFSDSLTSSQALKPTNLGIS